MYRIAVCEDEPIFLKYISEMTVDILSSIGESCEIWKYTSALGLESALQEDSGAYDILILDIMLGEINGVSFMEYLRDHGNCVPVIFISSSEKFVFDAYSAEPVGYILKPVSRQKLAEALNRAIRHLTPKSIVVDTPSATVSFHTFSFCHVSCLLPQNKRFNAAITPYAANIDATAIAAGISFSAFAFRSRRIHARSLTGFVALSSMYSCAKIFRLSLPHFPTFSGTFSLI